MDVQELALSTCAATLFGVEVGADVNRGLAGLARRKSSLGIELGLRVLESNGLRVIILAA